MSSDTCQTSGLGHSEQRCLLAAGASHLPTLAVVYFNPPAGPAPQLGKTHAVLKTLMPFILAWVFFFPENPIFLYSLYTFYVPLPSPPCLTDLDFT